MATDKSTAHLSDGHSIDKNMGDLQPNGLALELASFGLEKLYDYEQGGHHPIHLGDLIGHEGRYRVIHKLGNGGFANVWLCRDTTADKITKYAAIKILMAEVSTEECAELQLNHLEAIQRNPQGGNDLTPSNVLHQISSLDGLVEEKVLEILGKPILNKVIYESGEPHTESSAPQYLVYPVNWFDVNIQYISKEPCVIDFGESFQVSKPPEDLGIPGPYRSPELILEKAAGFGSDLWALGCTLFEIRTGRKLFSPFDDDDDSYLDAMVQVLGVLPEQWWSETWQGRRRLYKDEPDSQGIAIAAIVPEKSGAAVTSVIHPSVAHGARSLQDMLAPGLWYLFHGDRSGNFHRDISNEEKAAFSDLLGALLAYCPNDRTSAEDALSHKWFRYKFS